MCDGQAKATRDGFDQSAGDCIIFLDSDDMLEPSIIREAIKVMTPSSSMIRFQMKVIAPLGCPLGPISPKYSAAANPESIRRCATSTGSYPGAATSEAPLLRSFLGKIVPFEGEMD
jgi:cellulose synthase/poly-beta-1,6-N-acetylglucosamine synthase-like glycosyltransferase